MNSSAFKAFIFGLLAIMAGVVIVSFAMKYPWDHLEFKRVAGGMIFLAISLCIYLVHLILLTGIRSLNTRSARSLGGILLFVVPALMSIFIVSISMFSRGNNNSAPSLLLILIPLSILCLFPGFLAYSLPSTFLSSLPLLLHYLYFPMLVIFCQLYSNMPMPNSILFFAYLPLAGYFFPMHRRMKEYWKPARLPRLRGIKGGFTLIELLIVIAIIAILSVAVARMTSNTQSLLERQRDWREAVTLAEEQLDILRARDALPGIGRQPIDPLLTKNSPLLKQAEIEIRPGPGERLREVRVTIHLRGANDHRDVSLAEILPARQNFVISN